MALRPKADLRLLNGLLPFSSVFLPLFPVFNFASPDISLYTVPPSSFLYSSWSTSFGIIIKFLTYFSFTIHSINTINPFQRT